MNKTLQGIVRGRTIELDDDPGIEEGRKVEVLLRVGQLPGPPPRWQPSSRESAAGMMAEHWSDEDDRILEEIHRDRKRDSRSEPGQ
jgi:hypothetical protein